MPLRVLYLHGFGSGPDSAKGRALAAHLGAEGVIVERLDLRVPSFAHLRPSVMIARVQAAIGGPADRVVVMGSSLGGLVAARVAERDPRVQAVVLLAPAFGLAAQWQRRSPEALAEWRETGWLPVTDHTTGRPARVDLGFLHDVEQVDAAPAEVHVPTLVLHGRRDEVVELAGSQAWVAGRSNTRLVELDDDHELLASVPRICAETSRFLAPWAHPEGRWPNP